jgi:N-acetylmuramoyl-L-alanine amidase
VLAGIDMPAVLIELGYLTSPEFAGEVVTEPFQTRVAQSIADAVADFVAGVEPEIDTPR